MVSYAGGARYYLESPEGGPDWGVRFVVTLLYPNTQGVSQLKRYDTAAVMERYGIRP